MRLVRRETPIIISAWLLYALLTEGCSLNPASPDSPVRFAEREGATSIGMGQAQRAELGVAVSEKLGRYLVDDDGSSLYVSYRDRRNYSECMGTCATVWLPVLSGGKPVAGPGVNPELLGLVERADRTYQVTYHGWPLYYYINDVASGDRKGHGLDDFDASWFLLGPDGTVITTRE